MRFIPETYRGKKACILGGGRSGVACAKLLAKRGYRVLLSEEKSSKEMKGFKQHLSKRVHLEMGGHTSKVFQSDFVVKSPGISNQSQVLRLLARKKIPVFSEMEIALAFCSPAKVFAVTGTNGKTTTTTLLGQMLKESGKHVFVSGNIGIPLSLLADQVRHKDYLILEVSSYQLEDSQYFRPNVAVILNITPDHLEHHGNMTRYIEAKKKIFKFQKKEDACVFNGEDRVLKTISRQCNAQKYFFGLQRFSGGQALHSGGQAFYQRDHIRIFWNGKTHGFKPPQLLGEHNLQNSMAAALMALSQGVSASVIRSTFHKFRGVEHRLESAGVIRGVRCINDSKATNVDSTLVALKALSHYRNKIFLILGGRDKGSPYLPLRPWISRMSKAILTIGEAAPKIERELKDLVPILGCQDLEKAVNCAFQLAEKGDLLLLSPACASFDQFRNFEDRGKRFKTLVHHYDHL